MTERVEGKLPPKPDRARQLLGQTKGASLGPVLLGGGGFLIGMSFLTAAAQTVVLSALRVGGLLLAAVCLVTRGESGREREAMLGGDLTP
jgi:hypothetical protein